MLFRLFPKQRRSMKTPTLNLVLSLRDTVTESIIRKALEKLGNQSNLRNSNILFPNRYLPAQSQQKKH